MVLKDQLTSQRLRSLFKSNFTLAAYAIAVAKANIREGREMTLDELLEEVRLHPNQFDEDEVEELDEEEDEEENE
jgi:DnaJ-domain-containing protein 1